MEKTLSIEIETKKNDGEISGNDFFVEDEVLRGLLPDDMNTARGFVNVLGFPVGFLQLLGN